MFICSIVRFINVRIYFDFDAGFTFILFVPFFSESLDLFLFFALDLPFDAFLALVLPFIFFLSFSTVAALLSALRTKNIVRQNKRMKSNPSNEGMMISNQNFNRSSLYSSWKRRNRFKGKSFGYIQL